jgi:hypothetical protein
VPLPWSKTSVSRALEPQSQDVGVDLLLLGASCESRVCVLGHKVLNPYVHILLFLAHQEKPISMVRFFWCVYDKAVLYPVRRSLGSGHIRTV